MSLATTLDAESEFDDNRMAAFEERIVHALNEGAVLMMTSIGHRTGLFDKLKGAPPLTSQAIADRAGLNERYVREWLGSMVTGGVIELDPTTSTYRLPDEHASLLTRDGPANLAVFAQYIPLLGTVEDEIITCFRQGGGLPYDRYPRFHEVMAEDSGQTVVAALDEHILPLAPSLVERLTAGIKVLDVGCGRGLALMRMAESYPKSQFTGYDLSDEATDWATARAHERGLTNITFKARDLSNFHHTAPVAAFDLVTSFDAIHDQAQPLNVLKGIRRAVADAGIYLAQDIKGSSHHHGNLDHPLGPLLYTISCMHCMSVSLAQGGEGLGAMWGRETAERYLHDAGFGSVQVHELDHDIQNYYYVCRP